MKKLCRLFVVVSLLVPSLLFAQADQAISVTDSPDPAAPGATITYAITVVNNGPSPAVNGGFNANLGGNLTYLTTVTPAGFTCATFGSNVSCTNPSFAPGTANFTMTVQLAQHLQAFPDGTVSSNFSTSGTTIDPVGGNNSVSVTTAYDSPQSELSIAATDSPDPVGPDGDITYTVTVTNAGPQAAQTVNVNVPLNNTLRVTSVTAPAGFTCPGATAGSGASFTCTAATMPVGSAVFTIVLRANDEQFGIIDQTITQNFNTNSAFYDSNPANNSVNVTTQYVTPDANLSLTATDAPDPVHPDGDITYTITVANAGPDAAPNALLNVPLNNTLRFRSIAAPAGFTCTPPPVDGGTSFSCTNPSMPSGYNGVFTLVLRANDEQFGIQDQAINQFFGINSSIADPNNANNQVTVTTQYDAVTANVGVTATDSPDPVTSGNNITYTINVTNAGPDAAPNAQLVAGLHPSLQFQSIAAPAGFTCTTPAVGAHGIVTCTNASLASGANVTFTLVVKAVTTGPAGTINQVFSVSSNGGDPAPANNSVEVFTNYLGQTSDLSITKTTGQTAIARGGTLTYTITTGNAGPNDAANVTVTDALPSQLRFQSITAPAGFVCTTPAVGANGTITCTAATLANGATATFTLTTTVAPNATGPITNTATIGATGSTDPNGGNSSGSTAPIVITPDADLGVTKTTLATTVAPGGALSYTITLTNAGPDAAANVVMTDALPASLLFQSITAPAGFTCTTPAAGASGTITCNGATLASGANAAFTLNVTVAANATGTITNSANVTSATNDPNAGNNGGNAPGVTVTPGTADVGINKTTLQTQAVTGGNLTFNISVSNAGPATANNVVVTDTLPAGVTFVSATPSQGTCTGTTTITCSLGSLLSGANATIQINTLVTATSGTISNTATVTSSTGDPNGGNNTSTTPPVPATNVPSELGQIPTLSEWALMALALMLGGVAVVKMRG